MKLATIKDFMLSPKVLHGYEIIGNIIDAAVPFFEKPTIWRGAKMAGDLLKVVSKTESFWSDEYFITPSWTACSSYEYNKLLYSLIREFPYESITCADDEYSIRIHTVNGIKFGYVFSVKAKNPYQIHIEPGTKEDAYEVLKNLIWSSLPSKNIVFFPSRKLLAGANTTGDIEFDVDVSYSIKNSQNAEKYTSYIKKCMDANINRSLMFYGPPGSGKSTLARTIVSNLGFKSIRFRIEDLTGVISNQSIFEAIEIFKPDAIILDDFDRTSEQAHLLEMLEYFQTNVKLVILTINNRSNLNEAILRPGRVDELIFVNEIDENVIRGLLGENLQDAYDLVKDWPIAFIQEYVKRRKFLSSEEAENSTRELVSRVMRLKKYSEDNNVEDESDDFEKMNNTFQSSKTKNPRIGR